MDKEINKKAQFYNEKTKKYVSYVLRLKLMTQHKKYSYDELIYKNFIGQRLQRNVYYSSQNYLNRI